MVVIKMKIQKNSSTLNFLHKNDKKTGLLCTTGHLRPVKIVSCRTRSFVKIVPIQKQQVVETLKYK